MPWKPCPRKEHSSCTFCLPAIGETRQGEESVFSLQTTDRVFLLRIGEEFLSHFSPQKVRRVPVLVCGSQVGLSINMEAGFGCAAAHSSGEAGPVSPSFSRSRKYRRCVILLSP